MKDTNAQNLPPIFRFLLKHKWRLIIPVIFIFFYVSLPLITRNPIAVQQNIFIKSSQHERNALKQLVQSKIDYVQSDSFLTAMIVKYEIFGKENLSDAGKIEKLRQRIEIRLEEEELEEGVGVYIWTYFKNKTDVANIADFAKEIAFQIEQNQNLHIDKYVTKPYDSSGIRGYYQVVANIFQALFFISFPLIFLWEIPNMFYSPKTKEMVFEPLKADWQEEVLYAKMRKEKLKVIQINVKYSAAFLSAMIQKSPLGDLFEYFGRFAR